VTERAFWRTAPIDVAELAAIQAKRRERDRELAAWMVSSLMTAWIGKDAPTMNELLGRTTDA
jgi:hypothetical protein